MNCPLCGAPIPNDSAFCPECGHRLDESPATPPIPGKSIKSSATKSEEQFSRNDHTQYPHAPEGYAQKPPISNTHRTATDSRMPKPDPRKIAFVAIAMAVFMVIGCVTAGFLAVRARIDALHQPHPVTFMVNIADYDLESSRIPVRITGEDLDGNDVNKTIFLAHSGADVELPKGRYAAEVLGSPINSKGIIYKTPTSVVNFTLGDDLEPGEGYNIPPNLAFLFLPIDPANMTDEQVEDALRWARKDEQSGIDVGKLEKAVKKLQAQGKERS